MDALNITKSDLKFLLVMSSIVPALTLIGGFYIANSHANPELQTEIITSHLPVKPNNINITALTPDYAEEELTVIDEKVSVLETTPIAKIKHVPITKRYIVQAGLFSDINNANKFSNWLSLKNLGAQIIDDSKNGNPIFRVIIGSFESEVSAQTFLQETEQAHSIKLYLTDISTTNSSNFIAAL